MHIHETTTAPEGELFEVFCSMGFHLFHVAPFSWYLSGNFLEAKYYCLDINSDFIAETAVQLLIV